MTQHSLESATFADANLDDTRMPTFVFTGDAGLMAGLVADRFGADPSIEVVRLRFGGEAREARYLTREALYGLLTTGTKGFGLGSRATLPGLPVPGQATDFEFRCPVAGCPDSPVFLLAFSEIPACFRHGVPLELVP